MIYPQSRQSFLLLFYVQGSWTLFIHQKGNNTPLQIFSMNMCLIGGNSAIIVFWLAN